MELALIFSDVSTLYSNQQNQKVRVMKLFYEFSHQLSMNSNFHIFKKVEYASIESIVYKSQSNQLIGKAVKQVIALAWRSEIGFYFRSSHNKGFRTLLQQSYQ